jgi:hypothetical protein
LFEALLQQADRQLASAPRYVHIAARDRLKRFAASGRASPLLSTRGAPIIAIGPRRATRPPAPHTARGCDSRSDRMTADIMDRGNFTHCTGVLL